MAGVVASQKRSDRNVFRPKVDLDRRQQKALHIVEFTSVWLTIPVGLRSGCAQVDRRKGAMAIVCERIEKIVTCIDHFHPCEIESVGSRYVAKSATPPAQ